MYLVDGEKREYNECKWVCPVSFFEDIISDKKLDNPVGYKIESDKVLSRYGHSLERF